MQDTSPNDGAIQVDQPPPPLPVRADAAPDWSSPDVAEVVCPLCEYNLRGLTEPRCPECGFAFTWRGLIEQRDLEHPYLFEHHARKRPVWSFVRTLLATALPWRFWRLLRPGNEPHVKRLIAFWLIGAAVGAVLVFFVPVTMWWVALTASYAARGSTFPWPLHQFLWLVVWNWRARELPTLPPMWLVLMPAFSAGSLFIFRESLRQARLRTIHVLRVAIYSWGLGLVLVLLALPMTAWFIYANADSGVTWRDAVDVFTIAGFVLILVLPAVSVIIASRRYLAIPRATLTAVLSQLLAILAIGKLTQMWMWSKW